MLPSSKLLFLLYPVKQRSCNVVELAILKVQIVEGAMTMIKQEQRLSNIRAKINELHSAHQTQEDNWRHFLRQAETLLREAQTALQDCAQKQQDFNSKLEQELQMLEQDIGAKSSFIASISPSNLLAKQEQVAQKRVSLLQGFKQGCESMTQLEQQLAAVMDHAAAGLNKLSQYSDPVRAGLQDLATEFSNLGNLTNQAQPAASAPMPAPTGNPTAAGRDSFEARLLTQLTAAETALKDLQQVLEKNRLLNQLAHNINEFGHSYNLH